MNASTFRAALPHLKVQPERKFWRHEFHSLIVIAFVAWCSYDTQRDPWVRGMLVPAVWLYSFLCLLFGILLSRGVLKFTNDKTYSNLIWRRSWPAAGQMLYHLWAIIKEAGVIFLLFHMHAVVTAFAYAAAQLYWRVKFYPWATRLAEAYIRKNIGEDRLLSPPKPVRVDF